MRRRLLPLVLVSLMLASSMASVLGASGREVVDNWDDGDAWVEISLISWVANQTEEWDSSGGLPDPRFKICLDVDGEDLDCIDTPTWENQWELNATWNYTIDIPDTSNLLNITIECEDNDAFNDDECDMNADVNEWKLYAEYNWSQNPNMTISGNGDGDGNGTWKNAASAWGVKVFGFGDEDGDGVPDNIDLCAGTNANEILLNNSTYIGCSWGQWDLDGDGVASNIDSSPFNDQIGLVSGGGRDFNEYGDGTLNIPLTEFEQLKGQNYIDIANDVREIDTVHSPEYQFNDEAISLIHTWTAEYDDGENIICESTISSKQYYGDINTFELTEIIKLNYTIQTSEESCSNERVGLLRGHIGTFGDFDGNGVPDFVHSVSDYDQEIYNRCEVYFGLPGEQISFHGPIIIGNWQTETSAQRDECKNGNDFDTIGIIAADIDNDGFEDIITQTGIIFMSDDGFESSTKVWLGGHIVYVLDYDGDGGLDLISECNPNNSDYCMGKIGYNLWIQDEDGDAIEDGSDACPGTPLGELVDENGCGLTQRDTDMDGINDATDQCPNTPLGYPVNFEGCGTNQLDSDGDGISDAMDLCPTTPAGESTNLEGCSQSEVDTDADGVVNSNDACPGTAQGSIVDANGCSEPDVVDNDADGDGVVDTYDACPSTIVGSTVDQNGCSDAQLDIDGDGVPNTRDQCPGTSSGAEVSYYGCSASQGDEDLDGVLNVDDDCPGSWFVDKDNPPETSNGCDGMLESQDDDEDGDGLVDSYDECPDTPAGQSVDDQGCTAAQRNTLADEASSEGDTGDAIVGMFCCFGLLWLVFSATTKSRKKSSTPPRYVQAPPQVIHQQSIHQQQQVMRELENQRRQAEHQVAQLQQQLHQSNQMSATQLASVQSQLSDMQQQVTATNMAKTDMQRELEHMKAQEVERNTLTESPVNIQDSAVAGDSLIGSTKIENQTVNDADAIARAAAAAAIDAYRMGLDDRER